MSPPDFTTYPNSTITSHSHHHPWGKKKMNRTLRTRATALLGAVVLGAVAVLGAAVPANAVNIDTTAPVSLTIHKHEQTSTNGTTPGSGAELTPAPGPGINGVSFDVQRVGSIDLATDAGWNTVEAIQARLTAGDTITEALAATSQTLGAATTVTTATVAGQDGVAVFDAVKTMYLVTETTAPSSVTAKAAPFLVTVPQAQNNSWIYNVHVYPKNSVTGLTKDVVPPTPAETAAGRDLVRYDLVADVPFLTSGTTTFSSFSVSDTIDTAYQSIVTAPPAGVAGATVTLADSSAADVALVPADYTIAPFNGGTEYRVTFEPSGLAKLAGAQGGQVTFTVLTRITNVPTNGQIVNRAGTSINGAVNGTFDGVTPGAPIEATTEFGDLQIFTHVNGANTPLGPATYGLVDATTGNPVMINGSAVTGVANATTGLVTFENIPVGDYELVVVIAPAGYNLVGTSPIDVTVVPGTPVRDAANPTAPGNNYVPVAYTQTPAWVLPLTGGDGGVLFTVGGGALVAFALGAAFTVARRKRAAIDEVETAQV